MSAIDPALRANLDRALSNVIDKVLEKAALHDGKDVVEANIDLTLELLQDFSAAPLAAAAAALAIRMHRAQADPRPAVTVDHRVIMAFIQAPDEPDGDIGGPLRIAFRAAGIEVAE